TLDADCEAQSALVPAHDAGRPPPTPQRAPRRASIAYRARVSRLNEGSDLPYLCSHNPTGRFGLARVEPELKLAVAIAPRPSGTLGPTVHPTPAPSPRCRPPAGLTGPGLCPTSESFAQIRQPALNVRLTYGVVFHFWPPPSRSPA